MNTAQDEFGFLAGDAARVGASATLPPVARFSEATEDGAVSGLQFGTETPRATFLHGAGLNAHTFDPTVLALGLPALSLDLPGHGRSEWRTDADYRPDTIAAAVTETLRARTSTPRLLIGQSLGGLTALRIAADHPELVRHLVIIDITPTVVANGGGDSIREFIVGRRSYNTVDEIIDRAIEFQIGNDREVLRRGITLNTRLRDDGQLEWTHHLAHLMAEAPTDLFSEQNVPDAAAPANVWEAADAVAAHGIPVTLIRGDAGLVSDELLDEWRSRFSQSAVYTLSAGHNVQEQAPKELAQLVTKIAEK